MNWVRSIRFDELLDDAHRKQLAEKLPAGAAMILGASDARSSRTYGLVEGEAATEPAQAEAALKDARWYDEAIIVLAIEPTPADALPAIRDALAGDGGAAGVLDCTVCGDAAIVEFSPVRTAPALVLALADVELRRFHGYRKITLLNPLPAQMLTEIAAAGLQAPEIAPDRVLEMLLGKPGAE